MGINFMGPLWGAIFAISRCQAPSPLTQVWCYRTASDDQQPELYSWLIGNANSL